MIHVFFTEPRVNWETHEASRWFLMYACISLDIAIYLNNVENSDIPMARVVPRADQYSIVAYMNCILSPAYKM